MKEHRNSPRFPGRAKVKITEVDQGEMFLKDISVTGCRVECADCAEISLNRQYELEVKPEKAANAGVFDFLAEAKWIRKHEETNEIGFFIVKSPKGRQFQSYVDYLAWRETHGAHHDK